MHVAKSYEWEYSRWYCNGKYIIYEIKSILHVATEYTTKRCTWIPSSHLQIILKTDIGNNAAQPMYTRFTRHSFGHKKYLLPSENYKNDQFVETNANENMPPRVQLWVRDTKWQIRQQWTEVDVELPGHESKSVREKCNIRDSSCAQRVRILWIAPKLFASEFEHAVETVQLKRAEANMKTKKLQLPLGKRHKQRDGNSVRNQTHGKEPATSGRRVFVFDYNVKGGESIPKHGHLVEHLHMMLQSHMKSHGAHAHHGD